MKNILLVSALLIISIKGFGQKSLKGTYQNTPYEIQTSKPFDTVWSNLIDLFATKGISIKTIDKADGLIVSEKTSFLNSYTFENKKGKLIDTTAFVVTCRPRGLDPLTDIIGVWNVRIKVVGGKTVINVRHIPKSYRSEIRWQSYSCKFYRLFT